MATLKVKDAQGRTIAALALADGFRLEVDGQVVDMTSKPAAPSSEYMSETARTVLQVEGPDPGPPSGPTLSMPPPRHSITPQNGIASIGYPAGNQRITRINISQPGKYALGPMDFRGKSKPGQCGTIKLAPAGGRELVAAVAVARVPLIMSGAAVYAYQGDGNSPLQFDVGEASGVVGTELVPEGEAWVNLDVSLVSPEGLLLEIAAADR